MAANAKSWSTDIPKGASKEVRALLAAAVALGAEVRPTNSGHIMVRVPDGTEMVTVASTPSDSRATRNARARLRNLGLDLE